MEESFNLFWIKVTKFAADTDVAEPQLPRRWKVPRRSEDGAAYGHYFPSTAEDHFLEIYFEAVDNITACISNRFDQPGHQLYSSIQELLLKAVRGEDYNAEFDCTDFYGQNINGYM